MSSGLRVLQLGQGIRDPNRRNRRRDHGTASVQATPNLFSLAAECGTGSNIPGGFTQPLVNSERK